MAFNQDIAFGRATDVASRLLLDMAHIINASNAARGSIELLYLGDDDSAHPRHTVTIDCANDDEVRRAASLVRSIKGRCEYSE